jgi:ubiquitin carboxyl-terminal hydrolase 34
LDYTFGKLKDKKDDPKKLSRLLEIIEDLMDESEVRGIGNLKSLAALTSSEQIIISLDNNYTSGYSIPKKFTIKMYEGQTVLDLRLEI